MEAQGDQETIGHDLSDRGVIVRGTHVHIGIPPGLPGDPLLAELDLFIPEPQEP